MTAKREWAVAYFGCDGPWASVQARAARRRNTAILEALVNDESVARVLVFHYVFRFQLIRPLLASLFKGRRKVEDVFIKNILPERWAGSFCRRCNQRLMPLLIRWQAGSLDGLRMIVWSYWPEGFTVARRVGLEGLWVFDADHDLAHDENESAGKLAEIEKVLTEVIQTVDVVTAASRSALKWFEEHGARRVVRLRNGVAPARIQERGAAARTAGTAPRIGYVGMLSKWVDYELLCGIIAARPDWQFVIGGPAYRAELPARLERFRNVEFIGEVLPEALPRVLATFDVALGLYRSGPWQDVDSMKLFDYLGVGVPVICNDYHSALGEDFDGLVELAKGVEDFVEKIERVLNRDEDARKEWDARRRRFVASHTWSRHVSAMLESIRNAAPSGVK